MRQSCGPDRARAEAACAQEARKAAEAAKAGQEAAEVAELRKTMVFKARPGLPPDAWEPGVPPRALELGSLCWKACAPSARSRCEATPGAGDQGPRAAGAAEAPAAGPPAKTDAAQVPAPGDDSHPQEPQAALSPKQHQGWLSSPGYWGACALPGAVPHAVRVSVLAPSTVSHQHPQLLQTEALGLGGTPKLKSDALSADLGRSSSSGR